MSYRILFTATAKEDLRDIAFHIADISKDKNLALKFVNEMLYTVDHETKTVFVQAAFNAKRDYTRVLRKML